MTPEQRIREPLESALAYFELYDEDRFTEGESPIRAKITGALEALAVLEGRLAEKDEALRRGWERLPWFLLCRDTGREALAGNCPEHGGDACLFAYVQVSALQREALRAEPAKDPA